MAKIVPVKNHKIPKKIKSHTDCKTWLEDFFFESSCAYCWHKYDNTDVDHYVPKTLDSNLELEPYNFVISCIACNRYYKNDYHPKHTCRKKKRNDKSGCYLIDVRRTDASKFFGIKNNQLIPIKGVLRNDRWVLWNIAFFRLNQINKLLKKRADLLEIIDACQFYKKNKAQLFKKATPQHRQYLTMSNRIHMKILKQNQTFLKVLNITI